MGVKKKKKKIHPVKSRKAGISPKAKLFNGAKMKKRVLKLAKEKPRLDEKIKKTKIRVLGIGGGGGSIVSEIISKIKKADFIVANTDTRALKEIKKARRFQFGQSQTKGLGTGMNPELGEIAALSEKEKIKKLFEGQDLCIIIACLGGGTGSGASPVFAKISKTFSCLTYGIFTLPFEFEGPKKMEIAKQSLEKIKPNLNAFSIIPNERIFQIIDKNTPLKNALSAINERLAENLEGLIEMIYLPGLINIDFADLKTILSGRRRLAYLNTIEVEESSGEEALNKIISSPLYPYTIKGARDILYNVIGGRNLQLSEVSQISKCISGLANKNAKIIFGISQNRNYQNRIKITLLATGCGIKELRVKQKPLPEPHPKLIPKKTAVKPKPKFHPPKFSKKIWEGKQPSKPKSQPEPNPLPQPPKIAEKIRRNALQLRKVIEEEEKELLEKEKVWETPTILRKNHGN